MTKSEHLKLHRERQRLRTHGKPEEKEIEKFLQEGGIKYASRKVGVCVETLRKYYPELTKPYVRCSPANIDAPELIKTVLMLAADERYSYKDISKITDVSTRTCNRICKCHGVEWIRQSRAGIPHVTYDKRTAQELIDDNPKKAPKIVQMLWMIQNPCVKHILN